MATVKMPTTTISVKNPKKMTLAAVQSKIASRKSAMKQRVAGTGLLGMVKRGNAGVAAQ